ncbi:hypothetical protein BH11PLA2_BH11PLA2_14360 [soil metagenome]
MTVRQRALARIDVIDIGDAYAAIRMELAHDFVLKYEQFLEGISDVPKMCGKVSKCPRGRDIREGLFDTYPYIVTYELTATEIIILSVVHARRNDKPWLDRIG